MNQVMLLQSVLTTAYQEQQIEESDNAWVSYQDSTLSWDKYIHIGKAQKPGEAI